MNVVCASSARLPSQDAIREPSAASRARQASPLTARKSTALAT